MDPLSSGFWWGVLASIIASAIFVSLWPGYRWLSLRAIDTAVKRLPEDLQQEMREEWHAELEAYPEGILGLLWAWDLRRGAKAMAAEFSQGLKKETDKGGALYVKESLQPEEQVIYVSEFHWIYFLRSVGPLLGMFSMAFAAYLFGAPDNFLMLYALPMMLFAFGHFLGRMAYQRATRVVITNKRLILRKGWMRRGTVKIGLDRILGHKIAESALGRALGYGKITLIGAGVGEIEMPDLLSNPARFRLALTGKM